MYRIGCYYRLSDEDRKQGESQSIQNQRKIVTNFIRVHPEFLDGSITEFCDDGITGTGSYRPGLDSLLSKIKSGNINCVIVKDASRLGRNYIDSGFLQERFFPEHNVRFVSVIDGYDSLSQPRESLAFNNIINDLYSKDLSEKVKSVKYSKARNGEIAGGPACYGFRKDPQDKYSYLIDAPAARIVQKIFYLAEMGYNPREIAVILNKKNISTPALYKKSHNVPVSIPSKSASAEYLQWTGGIVYRLLRNPRFTGDGVYGQHTRLLPGRAESTVPVPEKDWIVHYGYYPALVSKKVFWIVQKNMNEKTGQIRGASYRKNPNNLFRHKIICGGCGCPAGTGHNKTGFFYRCPTKKEFRTLECPSSVVHSSTITRVIQNVLNAYINTCCNIKPGNVDKETRILSTLKCKKEDISGSKLKLYEEYRSGTISREYYLSQKEYLLNSETELIKRIYVLEEQLSSLKEEENNKRQRLTEMKNIKEIDQSVIDNFVEKVVLYPNKIKIVWKFRDIEQ
ncbi:MAG: recombinase family protein [Clostridiales bacterium]|nr:recombinase family protein [Clostridiales bacterium]